MEALGDQFADDLRVSARVWLGALGEHAAITVDDGDARSSRGIDREKHPSSIPARARAHTPADIDESAREGDSGPARPVRGDRDLARLGGVVRRVRVDRPTAGRPCY